MQSFTSGKIESVEISGDLVTIRISSCRAIPKAKTCISQNGDITIEILEDEPLPEENTCTLRIFLSSLPIENINNIFLKNFDGEIIQLR